MLTLPSQRSGILAAGNFIVDHVKLIDYYPGEEMLATIHSQASANGGGPYNILKNLAKMKAKFPLMAAGLLGKDSSADWILADCAAHGIDTSRFRFTDAAATSYTDAFTVMETGRRTFFHQPGSNAHFRPEHVSFADCQARIFYLGYLMLLDEMDMLVEGATGASKLLKQAKASGLATAVDCVSKAHPLYAEICAAALPFTDVLLVNEVEAGRLTGRELVGTGGSLLVEEAQRAAEDLLRKGVQQAVVIHAIQGALAVPRDGEPLYQASLSLPASAIVGATGAGDAFASGFLYAWHEGQSLGTALFWAVCSAAQCLSHATTSDGMVPLPEILALGEKYPPKA